MVMSCGPLLVVKDETGCKAPPVDAWAPEKLTVPKFDRWALLQKTPKKQMLGASAIHSAELLASVPVCVVEKVHPSLLVIDSVSLGFTGNCVVEMLTDAAGYISYHA